MVNVSTVEDLEKFLDEGYELFAQAEANLESGHIVDTLPSLYKYITELRTLQNRVGSLVVIAIKIKARFSKGLKAKKIMAKIAYAEKMRSLPAREDQGDGKTLRVTAEMKKQMTETDPKVMQAEKDKMDVEDLVFQMESFIEAGTGTAKKLKESSDDVWKLTSVLKYQMLLGQVSLDMEKISGMQRLLRDDGITSA